MTADSASTRLLLVRHGESQVMVDGVVGGPKTCSGLSDLGREQAALLRDRFASGSEPAIDAAWASPLPRAAETTQIVLPGIGLDRHETHLELEEFRLGVGDGLTWEQFNETYGWAPSREDPYREVAPGGDSRASFRHRVGAALNEIADDHPGESVFIGCHGGIIGAALALAFGVGVYQPLVDLPTITTSITELERRRTESGIEWMLRRYNDAAHLPADLRP